MFLQGKRFPAYFLELISALSPRTVFELFFFILEKNTISLYQVGTWHCRGQGSCWNEGRFVFRLGGGQQERFYEMKERQRKWNQAVNLVAAIFDLCLSANSITTLWLNVHAHYALYSPSRPCKYSTKYSASFCPNIFFHLYCIKTLRPIIGERKNTIFLLYNAFHSQLLY